MGFMFEDLDVYKRSLALAEEITRLTGGFSSGTYAIADQLRRAAISVPCNIAEGNGRWHGKERRQFFMIARGSAFECIPVLDIARRLGFVPEAEYIALRDEIDQICRMLTSLAQGAEENRRRPKSGL
jgi:four helix bundle protein